MISSSAHALHFLTCPCPCPPDTFLVCGFRDSPHISRVQKYMGSRLFSMALPARPGRARARSCSPVSKLEGGFVGKFIARSFVRSLDRSFAPRPRPYSLRCLPPPLAYIPTEKFAGESVLRSKRRTREQGWARLQVLDQR